MKRDDALIAQVTKLYYIDKVKQKDIASRYNLPPMTVTRLLRDADRLGIVSFHIKYPLDINLDLGRLVKNKYKIDECQVVSVSSDNPRLDVAKTLAIYVDSLLDDNTVMGVSWGKTIAYFADEVKYANYPGANVFQLSGSWLKEDCLHMSPSMILKKISENIHARPWFLSAPFWIPDEESRRMILEDSANRMVFDLAERATINLGGMSTLSRQSTTYSSGIYSDETLQELASAGAVGDFIGFFLDKDGNEVEWSKRSHYAGIPLKTIVKARNVITFACKKENARIFHAVMSKRHANVAIIDEELARAVLSGF